MAHAAADKKTSMSLGFSELAILISAVRSMFITTAWIRSSIAFSCGFLTLVGLRFMSYESHRARKWSLNLLPLLSIIKRHLGYLLNQVLYIRLLICAEDLSILIVLFFVNLLTLVSLWSFGSSTISNQLVAGSIIVRHIKSILEPSLPLRVYGPMRSTHNAS